MKNILLLTALFISFNALGQTDTSEQPVRICENMPLLEQCADEDKTQANRCTQLTVMEIVGEEINYPQIAKDAGVEGNVYVSFIVEKDGSIGEVKVMRGLGESDAATALADEAVRAVSTLPDFSQGTNEDGEAVRVIFVTPVRYQLSK